MLGSQGPDRPPAAASPEAECASELHSSVGLSFLSAEMGDLFKEISLHPHFRRGGSLDPQQMDMYFPACYDLDRFRSFVFESSFLERYEVEPELTERMRTDDEELLRFAFRWLRACLFSEGTVRLKDSVLKDSVRRAYEERMARQKQGG